MMDAADLSPNRSQSDCHLWMGMNDRPHIFSGFIRASVKVYFESTAAGLTFSGDLFSIQIELQHIILRDILVDGGSDVPQEEMIAVGCSGAHMAHHISKLPTYDGDRGGNRLSAIVTPFV
jgi:hypothetical protein